MTVEDIDELIELGALNNHLPLKTNCKQYIYDIHFNNILPSSLKLSYENFSLLKNKQFKISTKLLKKGYIQPYEFTTLYECCQGLTENTIQEELYDCEDSDDSEITLVDICNVDKSIVRFKNCKQTNLCQVCNLIHKYKSYRKLFYSLRLTEIINRHSNSLNSFKLKSDIDNTTNLYGLTISTVLKETSTLNEMIYFIKDCFFNFRKTKYRYSIRGFYWNMTVLESVNNKGVIQIVFKALLYIDYNVLQIQSSLIDEIHTYFNNKFEKVSTYIQLKLDELELFNTDEIFQYLVVEDNQSFSTTINDYETVFDIHQQLKNFKSFQFGGFLYEIAIQVEKNNFKLIGILLDHITNIINKDNTPSECLNELEHISEHNPYSSFEKNVYIFKSRRGYIDPNENAEKDMF